jgi:AraC-like DNA-binding protein
MTVIEVVMFSGFLIFCYLIIYKALANPEVFSRNDQLPQQKKKSLSKSSNDKYLHKLLSFLDREKPYLDPSLTLYDLAEKVSIPPRSLSEVIKSSLAQNFYDFINTYRIKESERLLSDPSSHHKTVLEILYEVGFNSKSSFNQSFKKVTGRTPSQYRSKKSPAIFFI